MLSPTFEGQLLSISQFGVILRVYSKGEVARARWRGGEVARRGGEAARSDRRGGEVARSEIGEARSKVP